MGKKADYRYVRVTASICSSWRTRGLGFNLESMEDVTAMFANLEDADLSGVKAIRVKPTQVVISKPRDISNSLDGAGSGNKTEVW